MSQRKAFCVYAGFEEGLAVYKIWFEVNSDARKWHDLEWEDEE